MNIEDIRKRKAKMEAEILACVADSVSRFENETGEAPYCIHIDMADTSQISSVKSRCIVRGVTINIDI